MNVASMQKMDMARLLDELKHVILTRLLDCIKMDGWVERLLPM